jgi:hypothetical protein
MKARFKEPYIMDLRLLKSFLAPDSNIEFKILAGMPLFNQQLNWE